MKTSAAIQRASRQAQLAMHALDRETATALLDLYQDAADDVRARIRAAAGAGDLIPLQQLQALQRNLEQVIEQLGQRRDELLDQAIERAAGLGVRPYTMQGVTAVGGAEAVIGSQAAASIHQGAVRFVHEFIQADGLQLSDRLWRLDRGAKEVLASQVRMAVVQGWSAQRAATDLLYAGKPLPQDLRERMARAAAGKVAASAGDYLADAKSGGLYEATRVMRTEINRAHGEAFMAAGEGTPGFAGWRYLLSPAHPAPDICDLLSTQNLHGLGPGVYPDRARTPWPAHPNTLSFLAIVFEDEISDADRAGKETSLQALARLTPDQRDGALGKTKAQYFDKGLLRTGMIRSPLRAVSDRLERQVQRAGALTWDEDKLQANLAARKLHFQDAARVFDGPAVTVRTFRRADGEPRWKTVGQLEGRPVAVVYTLRDNTKRVISMRRASKKETALWQQSNPS